MNNTLTITFDDDAPSVSIGDKTSVAEGQTLDGTWTRAVGADATGAVTKVIVAGVEHELGSPITVTDLGTLTVKADGTWTFVANDGLDNEPVPTVNFTVRVTDGDGDVVEATESFTITDGNTPTDNNESTAKVDDDGLTGGNPTSGTTEVGTKLSTFTGTLAGSVGDDGAGANGFAFVSGTGTVGQETVAYSWDAATSTLTATVTGGARDGTDLFTVKITDKATGAYTVTLLQNVLHATLDGATGDNTENPATLALAYSIKDADGSETVNNTLTITFDDDAPSATSATTAILDDDAQPNANTTAGETYLKATSGTGLFVPGADGLDSIALTGATMSVIHVDGKGAAKPYQVTWTPYAPETPDGAYSLLGTIVVAGEQITAAQLLVKPDGSYTYYQHMPVVNAAGTGSGEEETSDFVFGVKVTDGDGDTANASLTVQINDDVPLGKTVDADADAQILDDEAQPEGISGAVSGDINPNRKILEGTVAGTLFSAGADGLLKIELSAVSGDAAMQAIYVDAGAGRAATIHGIVWKQSGDLAQDGHVVLTGTITVGTTETVVAKLTVNADGSYKYEQLAPVVSSKPTADGIEETDAFSFTIKVTDGDGDWAQGELKVHINDDTPVNAKVEAITVSNKLMGSNTFTLDASDKAFALNYGADGGTVKFNVKTGDAALDATGKPMTSGGASITYVLSTDGKTLQGVTGYNATSGSFAQKVFEVSLDPANSQYTLENFLPVDVLLNINYSTAGYEFKGGNGDWNGFYNLAVAGSKDYLLTSPTGGDVNTATGVGGVGDTFMNGSETMRIDYVVDLEPRSNADKDFYFNGYYVAQGAGFSMTPKSVDAAIQLRAYDVTGGGDNATGAATQEAITGIVISNGSGASLASKYIVPTSTWTSYTVGADTYEVRLAADGKSVEVRDIDIPTSFSVFTQDGYHSLQVQNQGGKDGDFQFTKFVSTELSEQDLNFKLPLQLVDGDGDTATSSLDITLSGKSSPPVWGNAAMTAATVSEEGLPAGIPDGVPSDSATVLVAAGSVTFTDSDSALADLSFQFTSPAGAFTSGGKPVYWDRNVAGVIKGYTVTLDANGDEIAREDVITVTMDAIEQAGSAFQAGYQVELHKPLDHVKAGLGTSMPLDFGLKVFDGRSYSNAKTLTVHVEDDTPVTKGISHEMAVGVDTVAVNNLKAGFVDYVLQGGGTVPYTNRFNDDSDVYVDRIRWGDGNGYSSYGLVDNTAYAGSAGQVPLGVDFKLGDFTHNNQPIYGTSLDYVTVELKFDVIVNGVTQTLTAKFYLDHTETPNTPGLDPRDIIEIKPVAGSGAVEQADGSLKFTLANGDYALVVKGFRNASGNYVRKVLSDEGTSNTFQIYAVVEAEHEVAPVSASIFGNGGLQTGADNAPLTDVVWVNHTTQYGTFTGNADGTYSFKVSDYAQLNLGVGQTRTETFSYSYTDADGDTVTGDVSIDIGGYKNVFGASGTDTITGAGSNDHLEATATHTKLVGGDGDDYLVGNLSVNVLTGGAGADRFVFNTALNGNVDTITDFGNGADKLVLSSLVFEGLSAGGAVLLEAGVAATTDKPTVLYDASTGMLSYDKDGSGAGAAAVNFAELQNKPLTLSSTDFVII